MNGAACPKCDAPVEWGQSALGVAFLRDVTTGAEHFKTCGRVAPVAAPVVLDATRYATPWVPPNGAAPAFVEPARLTVEEWDAIASGDAPRPTAPDVLDVEPEWTPDDEYAAQMADVEEWEARRAVKRDGAGLDWPELRRAILAQGGIGPSPDWTSDAWPGDLYRRHGKAPDLVAVETTLGTADTPPWGIADGRGANDGDMRDYLQRSWDAWKRAQDARRPRARKVAAPVEPARALATPSPALDPMRSATLNLARLVADVADLIADGRAPRDMARQLADVARGLVEAQA